MQKICVIIIISILILLALFSTVFVFIDDQKQHKNKPVLENSETGRYIISISSSRGAYGISVYEIYDTVENKTYLVLKSSSENMLLIDVKESKLKFGIRTEK